MSKLERITVTMPAEMAARLRAAVERGEYATTSEVVREALRDWGEERDKGEARREWLRSEIEKGLAGPFYPADQVFAELRDRVREQVADYSGRDE